MILAYPPDYFPPHAYDLQVYDDTTDTWRSVGRAVFRYGEPPFKLSEWVRYIRLPGP